MQSGKFVYWEEEGGWLGYLEDYPDYWTQGETLEDLEDRLRDLYEDIVRQKIAAGLKAADEGRLVPHEEVKRRFLST